MKYVKGVGSRSCFQLDNAGYVGETKNDVVFFE
jgi:hypothetical protein